MFWPLCLEREVWDDPSFDFIICINLLKRVHRKSFHGTFLLEKKKKREKKSSSLHSIISLSMDFSAELSNKNGEIKESIGHKTESVDRPQSGSLPKPSNSRVKSPVYTSAPKYLVLG